MILPVIAYGDPVLRKVGKNIGQDYPGMKELIENMFETMYSSHGIGLAAPQIGLAIRLFLVDSSQMDEEPTGIKKVFINARILERFGPNEELEEGCLSIPFIRENVLRPSSVRIEYFDTSFKKHEEVFEDMNARVIQHEYDHTEGIMFTDLVKPLRKRLLKKKLMQISKGNVNPSYKMKYPLASKVR